MPAALSVDWSEIRKASEGGMPDCDIAEHFQCSQGAIRVRRLRENWITPAKLYQEAAVQATRDKVRGIGNASVPSVTNVTAVTGLGETLAKYGEKGNLHASKVLYDLILAASAETMKPISDVGDLSTAAKTLRVVTGLDKEGGVSVNLAMFAQPHPTRSDEQQSPWLDAD